MYETCPKCQYIRKNTDTGHPDVCPACGIIFSKWMKQQFTAPSTPVHISTEKNDPGLLQKITGLFLYVKPKTDPAFFYGRVLLFVIFFIWGWHFILMDFTINPYEIGKSFMHNINLVFHEAGHVIFRPFGWFMTILGGSLFQLLMPLVVLLTFTLKKPE